MLPQRERPADHGFLSQIGRMQVTAALAIGRHAEVVDAARRARRRRGADAGLALEEAEALLNLFRHREALAVATRAVQRLRPDGDAVARLRLVRAHALWMMGRVALARAELQRAGTSIGTVLTRARFHETAGLIAWKDQRLEDARRHVREAFALYAQASSAEGLVRVLEREAGILRDAGQLEEALSVQTRRVEVAAATTRMDVLAEARADRGDLLAFLGRWDEARRDLDASAELFRRLGDAREHVVVAPRRAMVDLASGDLGAVRRTLARIGEIALDESAVRLRGEHRLLASDLHLAAREEAASETAAAEAVALFASMRCREGECRARVRRAHALVGLDRLVEAVTEARRAARVAPAERRDLRLLALLARGRALLRSDRARAREAFESGLGLCGTRPGLVAAVRLGLVLARGAGRENADMREALASLEKWGDRRFLAYGLADVQALCGGRSPSSPQLAASPTAPASCETTRVLANAAAALLTDAPWARRWVGAMRAIQPLVPWWRAAWVATPGSELRRDLDAAVPLADDDLARLVAGGATGAAILDLRAGAAVAPHAAQALHGVTQAIVAPTPAGALYLDFREDAPPLSEAALGLAVEVARLVASREPELATEEAVPVRFPEILGRCDAMKALFARMARVASGSVFVHVFGETGTGKEKVAEALHARSPRHAGPFVPVNASTLSDDLFEAEMFGHTRGAFTGAVAERRGHVAEADGGTLFLDEVADLTPKAQAKLLRFLNNGEYRRLGESELRRANVRVITAANASLEERVREGRFREDLMYRLTDFTLALPPLRERGDDVVLLARHFLQAAAAGQGVACPALPADVAQALRRHPWPGNIRQLRSEMNRLVMLADGGPLRAEHLSFVASDRSPRALTLRGARASFERDLIVERLAENRGNRARTASVLGISRQALVVKIRQYGL